MSAHPRYNSRILAYVMRQVGAVRDRAQELTRYAKMMGRWSAERFLYPFYQIAHNRKAIGQSLRQTVYRLAENVKSAYQEQQQYRVGYDSSSPILRVLEAIQLKPAELAGQGLKPSNPKAITVLVTPQIERVPIWKRTTQLLKHLWPSKGLEPLSSLVSTALAGSIAVPSGLVLQDSLDIEAISVQGIASLLDTRKMVLVTTEQQTLDVLSSQQQTELYRRIIWEVASFYFQRRSRQSRAVFASSRLKRLVPLAHQAIEHFRIANPIPLSLPQEQGAKTFALRIASPKHWLSPLKAILPVATSQTPPQTAHTFALLPANPVASISAIAAWVKRHLQRPVNPFFVDQPAHCFPLSSRSWANPSALVHPLAQLKTWIFRSVVGAIAALPIVAIPAIAAESLPQAEPKPQEEIETQWVDPNHLRPQIAWDQLQGMSSQQVHSHRWLATQPRPQVRQNGQVLDQPHTTQASYSRISESTEGPEILIDAEFLGYDPHILEQILTWLDQIMVIFEAGFEVLWHWIGIGVVALLTLLQKLKQFVWD